MLLPQEEDGQEFFHPPFFLLPDGSGHPEEKSARAFFLQGRQQVPAQVVILALHPVSRPHNEEEILFHLRPFLCQVFQFSRGNLVDLAEEEKPVPPGIFPKGRDLLLSLLRPARKGYVGRLRQGKKALEEPAVSGKNFRDPLPDFTPQNGGEVHPQVDGDPVVEGVLSGTHHQEGGLLHQP